MTSVPGNVEAALQRIGAVPHLLVALDFDGTLAPLVDEPMTARATPEAKAAIRLLEAAPETTVAFVSGRTLHDLRVIGEHTDDSDIWLTGSHGAERWRPASVQAAGEETADPEAPLGRELTGEAETLVANIEGVWIEHKSVGFAVHTRLASDEDTEVAVRAVDALMETRAPSWRRREGKGVIEYAWRHEGKDTAIAELRAATGADAVLFAGDDVTDEDAIRSLGEGDLGIHVGGGETVARYEVADTPELAAVLTRLAEIRSS